MHFPPLQFFTGAGIPLVLHFITYFSRCEECLFLLFKSSNKAVLKKIAIPPDLKEPEKSHNAVLKETWKLPEARHHTTHPHKFHLISIWKMINSEFNKFFNLSANGCLGQFIELIDLGGEGSFMVAVQELSHFHSGRPIHEGRWIELCIMLWLHYLFHQGS